MKGAFLKAAIIGITLTLSSVANAGLIHSYDYNGNADDSVGSADGVVSGATLTTDRFGNANSAYLFNGQSYIDSTFTNPTTGTFSFWASLGNQSDTGDMLFSIDGPYGVNLWLYDPYGMSGAAWNTWDSNSNLFDGSPISSTVRNGGFHHYVVVNEQATNSTKLYIDGGYVGSADYRFFNGDLFRVGAGKHDLGYAWDGVIDEVKVYDTALNNTDINTLYSNGSIDVPEPSTLAIFVLSFMGLASRRFNKQS